MGIFNKNEEVRQYNLLINRINNTRFDEYVKNVFIEYVNQLKKGRPNDFGDMETLFRVMDELCDSNFEDETDAKEHLNNVIANYHLLVNKDDPNVENVKSYFIEEFVNTNGILYQQYFDEGMYALFADKKDYFEIMDKIRLNETLTDRIDAIIGYAHQVGKYCMTQDILKRDILAYLDGLENVTDDDVEKYGEMELDRAKRRIGVYNISSEELASVDSKLRRVEGYLEEFGTYMTNVEEEKRAITSLVDTGRKEIQKAKTESVEALKQMIAQQKQLLIQKLDEKVLDIEESLQGKSDEVFRQILESYQDRVEEFRKIFEGYSVSASKDLIAIQKDAQKSLERLKNYATDEPLLQEMMKRLEEQSAYRDQIIQLVAKEEELKEKTKEETPSATKATPEPVVIPGYDRIMVPYRRIVLPEKINTMINPYLDERIPFTKRKEELLKRIEEKEKEGEIFHKKVKEIAIDLMEGDWPYLWGPSGTGKSYMVKQVASLLGMDFMKAGKITEPYSVLGYNDPQGRFCFTPTFVAALYGHLLSLDEFDNGNTDTQVVLNDIYSELLNKLEDPSETCEVIFGTDVPVDINPNFRMISAGNTSGSGENEAFSSRGKIDESIQQRMTPIYIDFDDRVEQKILEGYPVWYKFITDFRRICTEYAENNGLSSTLGATTTRDAAAIKKYIDHNSKTIDQIIAEKFIQIKDSEYRKALAREIAELYHVDYDGANNPSFKKTLASADEKVLAKKFIYYCKEGVK